MRWLILICLRGEGVGFLGGFCCCWSFPIPARFMLGQSFSRFLGDSWVCVSGLHVTGTCHWHQRSYCLLPPFLPLPCCSSLSTLTPPHVLFFSDVAVWLWVVVLHGIAISLSFRSSCFLLVRPRGFQGLQSFQVFLSERQKLMWRSCPDLWESAAQQ